MWLGQFDPDERTVALDFVKNELIFLSDREIQHSLSLAYQDFVRPALMREASTELGIDPWRVAQILQSASFKVRQRRTLFMGMADGARLDQFRRANQELVHDQFSVTAEPPDRVALTMRDDLKAWLARQELAADATFNRFVLIDDFSGSGFTALRQDGDTGVWGGKLHHVRMHLESLKQLGVATPEIVVQVLLYTASEVARDGLRESVAKAGLEWKVDVVQLIPNKSRVDPDSEFAKICRKYHDSYVDDEVKIGASSKSSALGFRDSRLPLVLSHNTPNNSVGILWENTSAESESERRFTPLFPRHERHKADR